MPVLINLSPPIIVSSAIQQSNKNKGWVLLLFNIRKYYLQLSLLLSLDALPS
jgi:hypothetical protein